MKGALIGCGFFSQNHMHAWSDIKGVEVVALCDTDADRLLATGGWWILDEPIVRLGQSEHLPVL